MAVDMFLKLNGILGESKDKKHKDSIDIDSFSWGVNQIGSAHVGGGGGAGKVSVGDVTILKVVDKASPLLILACAAGTHIKDGLITVRRAGDDALEYIKLKLTDVLVTSVHPSADGGDRMPETVTLNFAKFEVDYQEQSKDGKAAGGPIKMGWDIKANASP